MLRLPNRLVLAQLAAALVVAAGRAAAVTPTNTTLTISPTAVDVGGSVLLRAVIDRPNATGTIHFLDVTNSVEVGTVFTINSTASFTYGPLSGSSRWMQARYDGDSGYGPSTSDQVFLQIGPPPPPPPPPPFASRTLFLAPFLGFDAGSDPHSVAISDLNADGRPDFVTANTAANSISVLLGNADGTFGPKTDFGTGLHPNSVAIADLNADGRPDLVTANADSNANSVSVLLGNGNGTFGHKTDFGTGSTPGSVAIADLNADGRPDLVTANIGFDGADNTVSVLLGNGDGTFGAKSEYDAGTGLVCTIQYIRGVPYLVCPGYFLSVAIADLNADGRLDLAVVNTNSNTVSVLLGNGDGTFGSRIDRPTGSGASSVAIADLNVDGRPDLVVANWGTNAVQVLLGNGDGTFGPWTNFGAGSTPLSVAIADLNADGRPDLATAGGSGLSVLLGNGNGTFGPRMTFHTGPNLNSLAIADLNADGRPDLATAGGSGLSVLLGNGNGTFGTNAEFATGNSPVSVAVSDLNADGQPDLVVANAGSASVSVLLGNGNGTFWYKTDYSIKSTLGSSARSVAIADFNADGKPDLVVTDVDGLTNKVWVLLGNGNGTFSPGGAFSTGTNPVTVATADLNADGRLDLAVVNAGSNTVSVLLQNALGGLNRLDYPTGIDPASVAIADLNADGRPDLVTANYSYDGTVSVLLGNGDGTFGPQTDFGTGRYPLSMAIADLNADGRPDLVTANSYSLGNTVSVLLGNGDGTFGTKTDFGTGSYPVAVAIADLNSDGRPDLAVANENPNTVSVLLGNGDGTFGTKTDFGTGSVPFALAIADFNADGRPDLAVANSGSSTVTVLLHTKEQLVATLLAQFDATSGPDGIELRWSFGDASRVSSATIERGPDSVGPWSPITLELRRDGDVTAALDRKTDPGRTYFYRLNVKLVDGSSVRFGPISSTASALIRESALNVLAPNPARAASQVQYSVARAGHVRLEVADVTGRVVTTLFDGIQPAGRFQLAWDGTNRGQRLQAGLYFVRLTTLDRIVAMKITRLP